MGQTDVAIVGAGPYGLATTAHLRRAGVETHTLGDPMSFWRSMPTGMLLRSSWTATCIAEFQGPLSLDSYCRETGERFGRPVPLERFLAYGTWVQQQAVPDVDRRRVVRVDRQDDRFALSLDDGETVRARRVVVAGGIEPFAHRPAEVADLPRELVSHTGEHRDLSRFAGQQVLVVGGGQSALESAALMHESGAKVEVLVRADHINWLHGGKYQRMLGQAAPLVYAPTDVGPMGLSRLVAVPDLFRRLPRRLQTPLAHRAIRPAGAAWLGPRLEEVPIRFSTTVRAAKPDGSRLRVELSDGGTREVDHLLLGTGYRVDVSRYPFLSPALVQAIHRVGGYPVLRRGLESSVPRLHFVGAPAAWSFGPVMRFVSGSWYASRSVVAAAAPRSSQAAPAPAPAPSPEILARLRAAEPDLVEG